MEKDVTVKDLFDSVDKFDISFLNRDIYIDSESKYGKVGRYLLYLNASSDHNEIIFKIEVLMNHRPCELLKLIRSGDNVTLHNLTRHNISDINVNINTKIKDLSEYILRLDNYGSKLLDILCNIII